MARAAATSRNATARCAPRCHRSSRWAIVLGSATTGTSTPIAHARRGASPERRPPPISSPPRGEEGTRAPAREGEGVLPLSQVPSSVGHGEAARPPHPPATRVPPSPRWGEGPRRSGLARRLSLSDRLAARPRRARRDGRPCLPMRGGQPARDRRCAAAALSQLGLVADAGARPRRSRRRASRPTRIRSSG